MPGPGLPQELFEGFFMMDRQIERDLKEAQLLNLSKTLTHRKWVLAKEVCSFCGHTWEAKIREGQALCQCPRCEEVIEGVSQKREPRCVWLQENTERDRVCMLYASTLHSKYEGFSWSEIERLITEDEWGKKSPLKCDVVLYDMSPFLGNDRWLTDLSNIRVGVRLWSSKLGDTIDAEALRKMLIIRSLPNGKEWFDDRSTR